MGTDYVADITSLVGLGGIEEWQKVLKDLYCQFKKST